MSNNIHGASGFINPILNFLSKYPMGVDKVVSEFSRSEQGEVPRITFQFNMSRRHNNNGKTLTVAITPYSTRIKSFLSNVVEFEHSTSRGYSYSAYVESYLNELEYRPTEIEAPNVGYNGNLVQTLLSVGVLDFKLSASDILTFTLKNNKYKIKTERVTHERCHLIISKNGVKETFRNIDYTSAIRILSSGLKNEVNSTRGVPSLYQSKIKSRTSIYSNR